METLHLKLSKEDKQTIKDLAKSKRMSMTGYIRNEILNKEWGLPYVMIYFFGDISYDTIKAPSIFVETDDEFAYFLTSPVTLLNIYAADDSVFISQTWDSGVEWVSWFWLLKDDRIVTKPMIAKIEIVMSLIFIINDLS